MNPTYSLILQYIIVDGVFVVARADAAGAALADLLDDRLVSDPVRVIGLSFGQPIQCFVGEALVGDQGEDGFGGRRFLPGRGHNGSSWMTMSSHSSSSAS